MPYSIYQGETGGTVPFSYASTIPATSGYAFFVGRGIQYRVDGYVASGNLYIPRSGISNLSTGQYVVLPQVIDSSNKVYFLDADDIDVIKVLGTSQTAFSAGDSLLARLAALEAASGVAGVSSFLALTDTPDSYAGYDGYAVSVSGSALVFTVFPSGSSGVTSHAALTGLLNDDHPQYLTGVRASGLFSSLGHTHLFSALTGKPTTISGYGITDAYTYTTASGQFARLAYPNTFTSYQDIAPDVDVVPLTIHANTTPPAFPQAALLDDFNRADAPTLGVNYTADPGNYGSAMPSLSGNTATPSTTSSWSEAWYNDATFGPNLDVTFVCNGVQAVVPLDENQNWALYFRWINPATIDSAGYWLQVNHSSAGDTLAIYFYPDGDTVIDSAVLPFALAEGDKIGLRCVGTTQTAYQHHGGAWHEIASGSDSQQPLAGYIGPSLWGDAPDALPQMDDLSAATIMLQTENSIEIYDLTNTLVQYTDADGDLYLPSKSPNLVFASPSGSAGRPSFRSLVAQDTPYALTVASGDARYWALSTDLATQVELNAHTVLTTSAHGGIVASSDSRLTDARTPTGSAGGDLTGTYPNPTLGATAVTAGTYGDLNHIPQITVDTKGRVTSVTSVLASGVIPSGLAGGVLSGTYPNPSFASDMATQAELDAEASTRSAADSLLAPLASPALTGNPTAPTQTAGNSSTRIATTEFVASGLVNYQPLDATLTALAGVVVSNNKMIYATGADTFAITNLTAAARTLNDGTSFGAMRITLSVPGLADANIFTAAQTIKDVNNALGIVLSGANVGGTPQISTGLAAQLTVAASGTPLKISASDALAGSSVVGAAPGGSITIQAGAAQRLTSGNANGGNIILTPGAGVGTGTAGQVLISDGTAPAPALSFASDSGMGFYRIASARFGIAIGGALVGEFQGDRLILNSTIIRTTGVVNFDQVRLGNGVNDTGINRNAAGIVEINNSTAGQFGALKVGFRDARTATVASGFYLGGQSSGTPAVGFGIASVVTLSSDTTADQLAALTTTTWATATHNSRKARQVFSIYDTAAREVMRFESNGSAAMWSVFGVAAALQQTGGSATASASYTATEQSMLQKVYDMARTFGFLT